MSNTPDSWADWADIFYRWWRGDTPVGAVLIAIGIAVLRVAHTHGSWRKMVLEGLLCGALTLTVASALEHLAWHRSLSVAIGGGIGFIGVDVLRAFALRFIDKRFGKGK